MIKQNIKVAWVVIICLITFLLVMCNFIKLDVTCIGTITFVDNYNLIAINTKSGAYIENHNIEYIKIYYNKQYFSCSITYSSTTEPFQYYLISLPDVIDKTQNYITTNVIIDSLNVYQYLIKK